MNPCQYRQLTPYPELYFCQSTYVHSEATNQLVTESKCNRCIWSNTDCEEINELPKEWPELKQSKSYIKQIINKPCINLGNKVRLQECTSCSNKPSLKVYECNLYKECTLGKNLPNLQCCKNCEDYKPKP